MKVSDMTQRHFLGFDGKSNLENYKALLRIPAIKHLRIWDGELSVSLLWLWLRFPATQTRADMKQRNFLDYIGTGKFWRQGEKTKKKKRQKKKNLERNAEMEEASGEEPFPVMLWRNSGKAIQNWIWISEKLKLYFANVHSHKSRRFNSKQSQCAVVQ